AVPFVHRRRLPADKIARETSARLRHNITKLIIDGLGEIAGKQEGKQSASLLMRCARHVDQLRPDGGRGEARIGSSRIGGEQHEVFVEVWSTQSEDMGHESTEITHMNDGMLVTG